MLTSLLGEVRLLSEKIEYPLTHSQICVLYVAIWVVTFRSFIFRAGGDEEEDTWTFGQIVPIVLLIAPIATLVEHFSRSEVAAQQRGPAPHTVVISLGNDDYEKSLGFFGVFLLLIPPYLSALFQSAFFSASPIAYLYVSWSLTITVVGIVPAGQLMWIISTAYLFRSSLRRETRNSVGWVVLILFFCTLQFCWIGLLVFSTAMGFS
jgi:hypothetical protein